MSERNLSVNFGAKTTEFLKGVADVKKSLTGLNADYRENQENIKTLEAQYKSFTKEYEELEKAINNKSLVICSPGAASEEEQLDRQRKSLEFLKEAIEDTAAGISALKTEEQILKPQIDAATKAINDQYKTLNTVSDGAQKSGKSFNLTSRDLTGLINTFRTGNISATSFARVLANVTPYAVAGLAIQGVIKLIKELTKEKEEAQKRIEEVSRAFAEAAQTSKSEYDELSKLVKQYEEIGSSTNLTADEKKQLSEIQESLNSKYLTEAERLDLVNGKYDESIEKLKELSHEKLLDAEFDAEMRFKFAMQKYNDRSDGSYNYKFKIEQGSMLSELNNLPTSKSNQKLIGELINLRNEYNNLFVTLDGGVIITGNAKEKFEALSEVQKLLEKYGKEQTKEYYNNLNALKSLKENIKEYTDAERAVADIQRILNGETESYTNAVESQTEALERQATAFKDNQAAASDLASEASRLSSAFAEMESNGSLTIETTLSLIDAGYLAALAIDEETGAVRLNADAYRDLAKAKYEAQQADYAAQIGELRSQRNALSSGTSYYNFQESSPQIQSIDNQIKVLELQAAAVGQLANAVSSGGASSSNSSNDERAQLNAYQAGLEKASKERIGMIQDEQKALKAKHDQEIAAINEEVRRRREMRADEEYQNKLDQINARLRYEHLDEFSRKQLEAEKGRVQQQQEDVLYDREIEAKKEALNANLNTSTEALNAQIEQINAALSGLKTAITTMNTPVVQNAIQNNAYNSYANNPIFNINTTMTEQQIIGLIKRELSSLYQ